LIKTLDCFQTEQRQSVSGLILRIFKMSNKACIRVTYAFNCVNRGQKTDFFNFLFTFDAFIFFLFKKIFHRILANYLNYIINKEIFMLIMNLRIPK
jgi:hypothetical protein